MIDLVTGGSDPVAAGIGLSWGLVVLLAGSSRSRPRHPGGPTAAGHGRRGAEGRHHAPGVPLLVEPDRRHPPAATMAAPTTGQAWAAETAHARRATPGRRTPGVSAAQGTRPVRSGATPGVEPTPWAAAAPDAGLPERTAAAVVGTGVTAVVAAIGSAARRLCGRPPDVRADRRAGSAVVATGLCAVMAPALCPLPVAWAVLAPRVAAARSQRDHDARVVDQLPDVADLLVLTTSAGLSVSGALSAIGARPGGPVGAGLAAAASHVERGGTTVESLALLADTAGPAARPLVEALTEHDRYGGPLRPALERVAVEARARRRRQAEEAARRLPVTLLFPLVLTTLPAFFLLAIVPLLAGSLGSLTYLR